MCVIQSNFITARNIKFQIVLIVITIFSNCPINGQGRLRPPLKDDTVASKLYLENRAKQLNIDDIHRGYDSLQIRIWYSHGVVVKKHLWIFKKTNTKWTGEFYDMISVWKGSNKIDSLFVESMTLLEPRSGWESFMKKLVNLKITSLPNMHDIPGLIDGWEDGPSYTFEIATKDNYRYYWYHVPSEFRKDFWQANAIIEILELIRREFRD